jgi:hypothetical protein
VVGYGGKMSTSRFSAFTDDELYMLKRQAIESSYEIEISGKYSEKEKAMHNAILNEIIDAIRSR